MTHHLIIFACAMALTAVLYGLCRAFAPAAVREALASARFADWAWMAGVAALAYGLALL